MSRRSSGRRLWRWRLALVPAGLLLLAAPLACSTTIVPPVAPTDPVPVFVIDYGMTSVVAVPDGDGLVTWAYGDWQYYALANNDLLSGLAALAWPTQGTLGRGRLSAPATAEHVLDQVRTRGATDVHLVRVGRAEATRLLGRLESLYAAHRATEVVNPGYRMSFVHHPQRYTWFWNSNHQSAAWLRELGCDIRGLAFASRWRVEG